MKKTPNHLINEKSPYLLQHAFNPVNWYPWGEKAFSTARRENKPIILSIGYSTCHWCHVMEKESFENHQIADIMNKHYVCIKLDREERPDIDNIYMSAVTALTGSGGWPLNVFLTPDLKPFFGGTYFPSEAKFQIISWPDLLLRIADIWEDPTRRQKLILSGDQLTRNLKKHLSAVPIQTQVEKMHLGPLSSGFHHYLSLHDDHFGGFGKAPKFPSPVIQNFLSIYWHHAKKNSQQGGDQKHALSMMTSTLNAMADGGIYDHVGGGFHRYSTDKRWHVPHFEKMLYDNAQLLINYLDAYLITRDDNFRSVAKSTADYILRDLHHPEGGFYSAEDADSFTHKAPDSDEKIEGAFYVWDYHEVEELLGEKKAHVFLDHYGLTKEGNVQDDPHGYFHRKNILYKKRSVKETANRHGIKELEAEALLEKAIGTLFRHRQNRPRPHLDDKILTSWNGLAISALSRSYRVFQDNKYLISAQSAARFIQQNLYDGQAKKLYRRWREGEKKFAGISEDFAFLIQGLIDLFESDFNPNWLKWALDLSELQISEFYDENHGGFFITGRSNEDHLIFKVKEENDSVIPSANSISAINLLRLSRHLKRDDFADKAQQTVSYFFNKINQFPGAMPQMLVALDLLFSTPDHVVISDDGFSEKAREFLNAAWSTYHPGMMVLYAGDEDSRMQLAELFPLMEQMPPLNGSPTAYYCTDFACREPVTDLPALEQLIGGEQQNRVW